ncbi:MAG: LytTR family DNA-binding domain-containing protein, partial [Flavobacteriaceae bacterium]
KNKPNVLFLDIQMPEMSGFELLEKVSDCFDAVIFVTAFNEFAIKAFEVSAMDYMLKPIEAELLKKCIDKVYTSNAKDHIQEQFELLLSKLNKNNSLDKIALPTIDGLEFVKPSNIIYCKSDSNYTFVFMKDKTKFLVSKTLKEIEYGLTNQNFFRIHNSYLINLNFIAKYYRGKSAYVVMEDKTQIPVSRNRKSDFLDNL